MRSKIDILLKYQKQGNVIKYVCRYLHKNGIEDLEKIKHYCDLEILKLKDTKKND